MDIDPNTGLPELPPDHFWRITDGYALWALKLKYRWGPFSFTLARQSIFRAGDKATANYPSYEDYLVAQAVELYEASIQAPKYLGDYPPKSLNTKEPS